MVAIFIRTYPLVYYGIVVEQCISKRFLLLTFYQSVPYVSSLIKLLGCHRNEIFCTSFVSAFKKRGLYHHVYRNRYVSGIALSWICLGLSLSLSASVVLFGITLAFR